MPNRILKESICTSEQIDALTDSEEVFFYRLMVVCDDFGLMDARLPILKAKCYPLKSIDIKKIQLFLTKLSGVGLVQLYSVDGKPFLHLSGWEKHQQIRAKKAKYPMPSESDPASDINCNQMQSNVPVIQSNPIQSESNPNPNPTSASHDKIVFDGSKFDNLNGHIENWKRAYPAIDVEIEINKAAAWLVANPKNKKSQYGRFLNGWLSRAQDRAPRVNKDSQPAYDFEAIAS